jgi:acyl carrier protein
MWEYLGVATVVLIAVLLMWWLDPNQRRFRQYDQELATREPLPDAELVTRYFATDDVSPDIPPKVRRVFANYMLYPVEKLLPDDDFGLFWDELDMVDLIKELESEFGIVISRLDTERSPCTIRAVSLLVARKVRRLHK